VYATLGADYSIFGWLGRWNRKHDSPFWAICSQSAVALLMIVGVGTAAGRATIDGILLRLGFNGMPWERYHGGFDTLLAATAPVFWALFLLTGLSVFVLRFRDGDIERPFAVPLFPLTPILFCAMCVYMLYSSLNYAGELTLFALVPLVAGVPLFLLSGRRASGW
jgi:amino acid transporter